MLLFGSDSLDGVTEYPQDISKQVVAVHFCSGPVNIFDIYFEHTDGTQTKLKGTSIVASCSIVKIIPVSGNFIGFSLVLMPDYTFPYENASVWED